MKKNLDALIEALAVSASEKRCAALGNSVSLVLKTPGLYGAATTQWPAVNPDNIALMSFECRGHSGMVAAVASGNYKDSGCTVASAILVLSVIKEFAQPLISEADIGPALRRSLINAHDDIIKMSKCNRLAVSFPTVAGRRTSLAGIGCTASVMAVFDNAVWGAHIGDTSAFIVRDNCCKKLNIEDTLEHHIHRNGKKEEVPADMADIVMRVLGSKDAEFSLAKVNIGPNDRLILGNSGLHKILTSWNLRDLPADAPQAQNALAQQMKEEIFYAPATLCVISILEAD